MEQTGFELIAGKEYNLEVYSDYESQMLQKEGIFKFKIIL